MRIKRLKPGFVIFKSMLCNNSSQGQLVCFTSHLNYISVWGEPRKRQLSLGWSGQCVGILCAMLISALVIITPAAKELMVHDYCQQNKELGNWYDN